MSSASFLKSKFPLPFFSTLYAYHISKSGQESFCGV